MRMPWTRWGLDSENPSESDEEEGRAHEPIEPPGNPEPYTSRSTGKRDKHADDAVPNGPGRDVAERGEPRQVLDSLWWQFGQGAYSLGISAFVVLVILAVDLIQPGDMKPWHVFGSVPFYVAAVAMFYRIERQGHRKRRARLPVDVSGGGRFALILAALALCTADDPDTAENARWIAYAALALGSMSDGAWIAIVASRQRIGFWRAWYELVRRHRAAQGHCWAALIRKDPR